MADPRQAQAPLHAKMPSGEMLQFAPGTSPQDIERTARHRLGLPSIDPGEQQAAVLQAFAITMQETLAENREMMRQTGALVQSVSGMAQEMFVAFQSIQETVAALGEVQAAATDASTNALMDIGQAALNSSEQVAQATAAIAERDAKLGEALQAMTTQLQGATIDAATGAEIKAGMEQLDTNMATIGRAVEDALSAPRKLHRDKKGVIVGMSIGEAKDA